MTTQVQIPYTNQLGDGSKTLFTYEFGIVEHADLYVTVANVQMTEYSDYTLQNVTDDGGEVLFSEAPEQDAIVSIFRRTTISQEVDYQQYSSFPAETHEWNLDKITFILQELINGVWTGLDPDGEPIALSFDLSVTANEATVTINNTGGTDAEIPAWVSGLAAGVYHAEVVPAAEVPDDGSLSTKPDGYIYIGT